MLYTMAYSNQSDIRYPFKTCQTMLQLPAVLYFVGQKKQNLQFQQLQICQLLRQGPTANGLHGLPVARWEFVSSFFMSLFA